MVGNVCLSVGFMRYPFKRGRCQDWWSNLIKIFRYTPGETVSKLVTLLLFTFDIQSSLYDELRNIYRELLLMM